MYHTQIQTELGFKVRENLKLTNTPRNHYLLAITKSMTILIHIGLRQNSSSSYFTSCCKIDSAFKLSECKQESECKFPMSSGAGARVTFLGTAAGVKKVTPITSGRAMLHFKDQVSLTCTEVDL